MLRIVAVLAAVIAPADMVDARHIKSNRCFQATSLSATGCA